MLERKTAVKMRKNRHWVHTFFIFVAIAGIFSVTLPVIAGEENVGFSYGTVSKISSAAVTIKEYNYEADEEADATYIIDAQTEFEGIKSVSEIPVGIEIDIFYEAKDGQKIAKSISLEDVGNSGDKSQNPEAEGLE